METIIDVTNLVNFENNDNEYLPITKCVCGKEFIAWEFIIDNDKNFCQKCPECGVKLYFKNKITVHQVIEK